MIDKVNDFANILTGRFYEITERAFHNALETVCELLKDGRYVLIVSINSSITGQMSFCGLPSIALANSELPG